MCKMSWLYAILAACFSPYIPLIIFMYTYPSRTMSPSILYRSLMSGGKYFECILVYSAIDMWVSRKKYFRSQEINLPTMRASEMVVLNSNFESKRDAAGDNASSWYSSLSPRTVNLVRNGSDFSGRQSTIKLAYVTVRPAGTSSLLVNLIVMVFLYLVVNPIGKSSKFISIIFPPCVTILYQ